jgi:hypothetical protein
LLRIALALAFFAVLGVGLDRFLTFSLRRLDHGDFGVWNRIVQGRIDADIVVNGSSRALTHYDPRVLEPMLQRRVFNIGLNGSQTDMQLARLKTYLRYNRKPALVVQNLDAFSFQVTHGEPFDPSQYIPYLSEPALYEALIRIQPEVWKWRHLPLYGYATQDMRLNWMEGVAQWVTPKTADTHLNGFTPREWSWRDDFERFRRQNPNGVRIEVEQEGLRQMQELVRLCTEQDIPLALVYSPEYVPMQQLTLNRREIFEQFRTLAQSHGAPLLDFSDMDIAARTDYFYNSQHLNARGAAVFSRELAARLATLGLVSPSAPHAAR